MQAELNAKLDAWQEEASAAKIQNSFDEKGMSPALDGRSHEEDDSDTTLLIAETDPPGEARGIVNAKLEPPAKKRRTQLSISTESAIACDSAAKLLRHLRGNFHDFHSMTPTGASFPWCRGVGCVRRPNIHPVMIHLAELPMLHQ